MSVYIIILSLVFCEVSAHDAGPAEQGTDESSSHTFIGRLFDKYGKGQIISFEGFEHLLQNIGIGKIAISDHDIHDHYGDKGGFVNLHDDHNHTKGPEDYSTTNSTESYNYTSTYETTGSSHDDEHDDEGDKHAHDKETHDHNDEKHSNNQHLHQRRRRSLSSTKKCLSASDILSAYKMDWVRGIGPHAFLEICPAIVYQLDVHACLAEEFADDLRRLVFPDNEEHWEEFHGGMEHHGHQHNTVQKRHSPIMMWGCAVAAVTGISLVGLLAVVIIPLMQKAFFSQLLQFLVAMAIGSLTGDALLHLIPHALSDSHDEGEDHSESEKHDSSGVFKGMTVLAGVYFFFIMERIMVNTTHWRKKRRDRIVKPSSVDSKTVGVKLSNSVRDNMSVQSQLMTSPQYSDQAQDGKQESTVDDDFYIGESSLDETQQKHGHSHGDVPQSVAAMAWVVIMGDGLHNFTDGLAIGAGFASSISGGLSTTVAVFCHELPHELGDFAVLLQAGMSIKQAIFYNIVSSILCFLGLVIGVAIGNIESANQWIFALVAGMFIYIALADMLPQLSHGSSPGEHRCCVLLLQLLGISLGCGVMLVIALFEHTIVIDLT